MTPILNIAADRVEGKMDQKLALQEQLAEYVCGKSIVHSKAWGNNHILRKATTQESPKPLQGKKDITDTGLGIIRDFTDDGLDGGEPRT